MKVDVTKNLFTLAGDTLKDTDGSGNAVDATLRTTIVNAILAPVQKESGVDKVTKYELAKRIYSNDEVDLNEDEIKLIKDRVGEVYPPLVVGQIFEILTV